MPIGERMARKQIAETAAEIEEWLNSSGDFAQGDDFDDDWIDGE